MSGFCKLWLKVEFERLEMERERGSEKRGEHRYTQLQKVEACNEKFSRGLDVLLLCLILFEGVITK